MSIEILLDMRPFRKGIEPNCGHAKIYKELFRNYIWREDDIMIFPMLEQNTKLVLCLFTIVFCEKCGYDFQIQSNDLTRDLPWRSGSFSHVTCDARLKNGK